MKVNDIVSRVSESITLKLNAKAVKMAEEGKKVYNLTAGQLPFRPSSDFINLLRTELDFLKSYQYCPVSGVADLQSKVIEDFQKSRNAKLPENFGVVVSNGAKNSLFNVLSCLLNPSDEVVLLAPFWVSYPEMLKIVGAVPKVVSTGPFDAFVPCLKSLEQTITDKTKAIIINSPNNPAGIHYTDQWMKDFAELMKKYPHVQIISDEIYYELYYYDPAPTYFYHHAPELFERTIIIDGISKAMASTGLRIGYTIAPKELTSAMTKLQGQTNSGANSLVQRALLQFKYESLESFLTPVKAHLRDNAETLRTAFRDNNLDLSWYQSRSAFYYLLDFSQTPVFQKYKKEENDTTDYSFKICEDLLSDFGVAMVPGEAFGMPNTARMSLVLDRAAFKEATDLLFSYLCS